MNRFSILALLIAFFVAGGVFAESKPVSAVGVVVSYTAADSAKGTAAILVVKVGKKDESFILDAKTVVSKKKKAVDAAELKAGEKVVVVYSEDAKMVMTAVSVTL